MRTIKRFGHHFNALLAAALLLAVSFPAPLRADLTQKDLMRDLGYLASDKLEGRATGEPGQWLAAQYIANRFAEAGLQPMTGDGYYQDFEVQSGRQLGPGSKLDLCGGTFSDAKQAVPAAFSPGGQVSGPIVFAGYGLMLPERGRNDYAGLDVAGKIVLVLSGYPGPDKAGSELERFSGARDKAVFATRAGAAGIVYVRCPSDSPDDEPYGFDETFNRSPAKTPFYALSRAAALSVLPDGYKAVLDEEPGAADAHLGETLGNARLSVDIREKVGKTANVVGLLVGSDPKLRWEYVVVGAHYDHLGKGRFGSMDQQLAGQAVHNGADDNASGTVGVVELADALAAVNPRPKRSVLFICFSGEELGLLGSSYYVSHPLVRLDNTVAMLNMDMIGRLRNDSLMVFGTESSDAFVPLLKEFGPEHDLNVQFSGNAPGGSDHAPFLRAKVPALFLFTGLHSEYHTSRDDWQLINSGGELKVLGLALDVVKSLADSAERPKFNAQQAAPSGGGQGGTYGSSVYVGTVPDFGKQDADGYAISDVVAGGPAATAGLQAGDIIVKIGDDEIHSIDDFMTVIATREPGQKVTFVVLRGQERTSLDVTLGTRRAGPE